MAVVMGAARMWSGLAASCSGTRVVCGVEPTRKSVDGAASILSRRVSMSSSGDAVAFRCQATTLTGARQTSDAETQRCLDDSRALLRDSFDAASGSGFEECGTGSPEERALCMAMAASSAGEEARVFHGRRGGGDWYPGLATAASVPEQEMPVISKSELRASFEAALQEAGRNAGVVASVAARVWRTLGDADRAEALFLQALELAPQDSAIHASYAEFLWQCDV